MQSNISVSLHEFMTNGINLLPDNESDGSSYSKPGLLCDVLQEYKMQKEESERMAERI